MNEDDFEDDDWTSVLDDKDTTPARNRQTAEHDEPEELDEQEDHEEDEDGEEDAPDYLANDEEDEESEESHRPPKRKGSRAEKRIRGLVSDKKSLEEKIAALQAELEETRSVTTRTEEFAMEQSKAALTGRLGQLETRWQRAYEEDNREEMFKVQADLVSVRGKLDRLEELETRQKTERERTAEKEVPNNRNQELTQQPVQVDPKVIRWTNKNPWFSPVNIYGEKNKHFDREMTDMAIVIHHELIDEGFDPSSDDYYSALDEALEEEFGDKIETARKRARSGTQRRGAVAGGSRQRASKSKANSVKLSKEEIARAKRMGVDPAKWAREKALLMKRGEQ